jgi:BlaI family transcriptional regulator, penicillinase repressor
MKSKRPFQEEPTKAELEILQVLWDCGPSSVRFVNEQLNQEVREVQYTSTLKIMQLMADKGLVNRDESQMQHMYSAAVKEGKIKQLMLHRFVDTIYKGSSSSLILQLLGSRKASKKELDNIKEVIGKLGKK